jgi:nucleoside-diphosphate-sugar epimerase
MQIFLTGATGFLGGELLVELTRKSEVAKIFCLVRASSQENAEARIAKIFDFHGDHFDRKRVVAVVGDLSDENLERKLSNHDSLAGVNTIIHSAANTSFTKIYDDHVESVNIRGTRQLLSWAQQLKSLHLFVYVGTAAICGASIKNALITEELSPNLAAKHLVKYSYTKMIGELLLKEYLPADKVLVVRPSIIMGDTRSWVPRSYVILWALAAINQLRLFPVNGHSNLDIISIDFATKSIIGLLLSSRRKHNVYHISSGAASSTTPEKVTNTINGHFSDKPQFKFVPKELLTSMKHWSKNGTTVDVSNPLYNYKDYLDYWIYLFGDNSKLRILFHALEPYINFIELGQVFDNKRLFEDTDLEPSVPAHVYMSNSLKYLNNINIFEGAIDP